MTNSPVSAHLIEIYGHRRSKNGDLKEMSLLLNCQDQSRVIIYINFVDLEP